MPGPNLLFLYTDEQRFDTLAAYGNTKLRMPCLNRLAERSTVFEKAYVTQPVCTPSRSSLLTGLYPHTNGCTTNNIPLAASVPTLAEMLPEGEYVTGHFGKWHLGDEIFAQHGFRHWVSTEDSYARYYSEGRDRNARSDYHKHLLDSGFEPAEGSRFSRNEAARLPEEYGKPAFLAERASAFLRQNRDRPFALFVNFLEPHMPFFGPRDNQYDPQEVDLPGNFGCPPGPDAHLKNRVKHLQYTVPGLANWTVDSESESRKLIARYWGLCSLVDTHMGAILRTLEECGLDGNTAVVFTSDHGDMMGSHQLLTKTVMYEESSRVPLLVRMPGQTEQRRVRGPVSQVDIVPTLLDLMGVQAPGHLEGESLAASVADGAEPGRDVVVEWNGGDGKVRFEDGELPKPLRALGTAEEVARAFQDPLRTIVTPEGWKMNFSPDLRQHELFDLNSDPLETRNLANDPAQKPRMQKLRERIARWQGKTGDSVALPDV